MTKRANPLAPWSDEILLAVGRGGQTFVAPLVPGLFDNNFIFNPTISKTQAIGTTCLQPIFFGHLMIILLNDQNIKSISSYRLFQADSTYFHIQPSFVVFHLGYSQYLLACPVFLF